jgi:hypothetical protein
MPVKIVVSKPSRGFILGAFLKSTKRGGVVKFFISTPALWRLSFLSLTLRALRALSATYLFAD